MADGKTTSSTQATSGPAARLSGKKGSGPFGTKGSGSSVRPRGCGPFAIGASVIVFVVVFGLLKSMHTIDAGDKGVVVCFGQVSDTFDPGLHVAPPWCDVTGIDVRTQTYAMVARTNEGGTAGDDSLNVQSSDNVGLKVDAAVIYHYDGSKAAEIYGRFKPLSNLTDVIRNTSRRQIRDAGVTFTAEELLGAKRPEFSQKSQDQLTPDLATFGVVVERVEIRDISPTSDAFKAAISAKVEQQQKAQAKQFELDAAQKDVEIKKVTAQADADAQAIRNSVPPAAALLQQQYIDALRNSQNRVIITDGKTPVLIDPNATAPTK